MLISAALLTGGIALLYLGGAGLVRGASAVALKAGISPFVVGMTVAAFATSSPELVISLESALAGRDGVAVGNVVGSNIANIGLVLGIAALLHPIRIEAQVIRRDIPWLMVVTLFVVWRFADGVLSRAEGLLLACGLILMIALQVRGARLEGPELDERFGEHLARRKFPSGRNWLMILLATGALAGGGLAFLEGAIMLATRFGISPAVIALTAVAVGTSLPELATSIIASLRGEGDICVGNVIGSNFFNLLAILGLTALITPLDSDGVSLDVMYMMIGFTALLIPFMWSGLRVGRREGAVLLTCYAGYILWLANGAPPA
jgi:cation:H+ antiporter